MKEYTDTKKDNKENHLHRIYIGILGDYLETKDIKKWIII